MSLDNRVHDKAMIHLISFKDLNYPEDYYDLPNLTDLEEAYPGITSMMIRGDILENIDEGNYRSIGAYFYDGKTIIDRNVDLDPYGEPTSEFKLIIEFQLGYWDLARNKIYDYLIGEDKSYLPINNTYIQGKSEFYWYCHRTSSLIDIHELNLLSYCQNYLTKDITLTRQKYNGEEYIENRTLKYIKFVYNNKTYLIWSTNERDFSELVIETLYVMWDDDKVLAQTLESENVDYILLIE